MEPEVNHAVLQYAQQYVGRKAGARGTCWDLAEEALKAAKAQTSNNLTDKKDFSAGAYVWGAGFIEIRDLQPGDIIQFENHVISIASENGIEHTRPHHTAIVESVGATEGEVTVLEQHVMPRPLEKVKRNKIYLKSGSYPGVGAVRVTGSTSFFHPMSR
jgi:hypothetical protein